MRIFKDITKSMNLQTNPLQEKKKREEFDYFIEAIKWVAMCA